jgi:hypothetical protein
MIVTRQFKRGFCDTYATPHCCFPEEWLFLQVMITGRLFTGVLLFRSAGYLKEVSITKVYTFLMHNDCNRHFAVRSLGILFPT